MSPSSPESPPPPPPLADAVKLYRDALPDNLLQQVREELPAIEQSPNYWTPANTITREDDNGADAELVTVEAVARVLYRRSAHLRRSLPPASHWSGGVEWWCQCYQPGQGLAFHFDKDEERLRETGEMRHPIFSSIVYLHDEEDDFDEESRRLGPTVVVRQIFSPEHQTTVPENPDESVLIYPLANSFCLFRGDLAHGVLDSCSKRHRKTLIINWWGCCSSLSSSSSSSSTISSADRLFSVREISPAEASLKNMRTWSTSAVDLALQEREDKDEEEHCSVTISCSDLPSEDSEDDGSFLLVDQILEDRGLSLRNVSLLAVEHRGLALCPIEGEAIGTLGAFVKADIEEEEEEEQEEDVKSV